MSRAAEKDFNAMLKNSKDMPKTVIVTDRATIERYGGDRMYFAPPIDYDMVMRSVPYGKLITVELIRKRFARENDADFTDPMTAGIFVNIAAWASHGRETDKTPYWRTLKVHGELNDKYPGGAAAQKELLESEGHTVIRKGHTKVRYFVKDYEKSIFEL